MWQLEAMKQFGGLNDGKDECMLSDQQTSLKNMSDP